MPNRKFANPEVYRYLQGLKSLVATTRFNNQTWQENQDFLAKAITDDTLPPKTRCIYPCSVAIGETVPLAANLFVLEMNNETNQLLGVGLIKNHPPIFHRYQVYSQDKYNTYAYQGVHRIDRNDMDEEELALLRRLEFYCFRGSRHQKRMVGIRLFPIDILYDVYMNDGVDVPAQLATMFKQRFL
jgi:hypothetical protein